MLTVCVPCPACPFDSRLIPEGRCGRCGERADGHMPFHPHGWRWGGMFGVVKSCVGFDAVTCAVKGHAPDCECAIVYAERPPALG